MKKSNSHKLKRYAALSVLSTAATISANADIIYTDINPDTLIHNGSYDIDLDHDGVIDFTITASSFNSWAFINNSNVNNSIIGYYLSGYEYASTLNSNFTIGTSGIFQPLLASLGWATTSSFGGQFPGQINKYIGVKFGIQNNIHYGWIRIDLSVNSDSIIIKDYAYNNQIDSSIITGTPISVDTINNILITDISDNLNSSDISLSFDKIVDETTVLEYRAVIIPSTEAENFTLQEAYELTIAQYDFIAKTGANLTKVLNSSLLDKNGNNLIQGDSYKIAIFTLPSITTRSASLTFSDDFTLTFDTLSVAPISNLQVLDMGDNSNSTDILISFNKSAQDEYTNEYRVFAMSETEAATFDTDAAYNVPQGNYLGITAKGEDIYQKLSLTMRSIDGNYLISDNKYCFYVMSVSNLKPPYAKDSLSQQSSCVLFNNETSLSSILEKEITITSYENILIIENNSSFNDVEIEVITLKGNTIFKTIMTELKIQRKFKRNQFLIVKIKAGKKIISKKIIL